MRLSGSHRLRLLLWREPIPFCRALRGNIPRPWDAVGDQIFPLVSEPSKQKAGPFLTLSYSWLITLGNYGYLPNFLLNAISPTKPMLSKSMVAGSGTDINLRLSKANRVAVVLKVTLAR